MRTDTHNNPAAITTDVARQAGLKFGSEYVSGDSFPGKPVLYTARLFGDPVALTIKVIDAIGYYTSGGNQRWTYIALPKFLWDSLTPEAKRDIVGFHYQHEGGTELRHLFPNFGRH